MIDGLSVLALVPARGGSKGLPGKNIRPAAGRPLLDYTVAAARSSACIDRVVLSSDDEAIMRVARASGCEVPFRRPAALATDEATSIDVVLHALDQLPPHDLVVLLQPTSPLRTAADIDGACRLLLQHDAPWIYGFHPKSYTLGHVWLHNRKPTDVGNNILKYQRLDVTQRQRLRQEWNRPVLWPLAAAALVLVAVLLPAVIGYRRRERGTA